MNELAAERGWSDSTARSLIHGGMLVDLRSQPAEPKERPIPGIPTWAVDRVAELNRERAEAVRASGCRVIGDPDSLVAPLEAGEQETPPDQVSLALAAASVAGVVDAAVRLEERLRAHAALRLRRPARAHARLRRREGAGARAARAGARAAAPWSLTWIPVDGATSTSPMSHHA